MDTKERYGINNRRAILLFVQMLLIKIGLVIQIFVTIFVAMHNLSPHMMVSSISMILAHVGVLFYGYLGYKKGRVFYYVTVGLFLLAILVNIAVPLRDIPQTVLLTILFGLMCVFPFKQENYKLTNILVFLAAIIALGFSVYSCIISNPNNLGDNAKVFPEIVMYLSLFGPFILTCLFAAAYNARHEKELNAKQTIYLLTTYN